MMLFKLQMKKFLKRYIFEWADMNLPKDKVLIGLTEEVEITGPEKSKKMVARIDTGATKSSIDQKLAESLGLGPILRTTYIRSANGRVKRKIIRVNIKIGEKELDTEVSIADRQYMKYKILIGQDILKQGFLIDPAKTH